MISVRPVRGDEPALATLGVEPPPRAACLLAERDGAAVGCCVLSGGPPGAVRHVRIDELTVRPGAAGAAGVERALLTAAERFAGRLGAGAVLLGEYRQGIDVAGYRRTERGYEKRL